MKIFKFFLNTVLLIFLSQLSLAQEKSDAAVSLAPQSEVDFLIKIKKRMYLGSQDEDLLAIQNPIFDPVRKFSPSSEVFNEQDETQAND